MDVDVDMLPAEAVAPILSETSAAAQLAAAPTLAVPAAATDAAGSTMPAGGAPAASGAAAPPVVATPLARAEVAVGSALRALWSSALIVEQGVAPPASGVAVADDNLHRLMGMVSPPMSMADVTNQNLQRQVSVAHVLAKNRDNFLENLLQIDRAAREIPLTVPKSVIECVESGHNPSLMSQRSISEVSSRHQEVRGQIFATKVLHDQLRVRMEVWDQVLAREAAEGNQESKALLQANLDTLRNHGSL